MTTDTNYPPTIEYGGLLWMRDHLADNVQYRAILPGIGNCRISQYGPESEWASGKWHAVNYMDLAIAPNSVEVSQTQASLITDTLEQALQACIDMRELMVADLKTMLRALSFDGDPYTQGFKDGAESVRAHVAESLKRIPSVAL